ncbi:MAG: arsinothricin resistance N-acetyltransferase ArsN1 family B [Candidatus Promineifilaceae bacterium]
MSIIIRNATPDDAEPLLTIYAPIVRETTISFELEPPTLNEFRGRIEKALAGWDWLVAEVDGRIAGYAYGSTHRNRAAYQYAVEVSAYVHPDYHRQGIGLTLYKNLLSNLAKRGYCNAYAAIALPNEASIAFHRRLGFNYIGTFPSVGRKFGRWHDVSWWHCPIRDEPLT